MAPRERASDALRGPPSWHKIAQDGSRWPPSCPQEAKRERHDCPTRSRSPQGHPPGSQHHSKTQCFSMCSAFSPVRFRWASGAPRLPKRAPRWAQDCPRSAQERPKMRFQRLQMGGLTLGAPLHLIDALQDGPKMLSRASKRAPGRPKHPHNSLRSRALGAPKGPAPWPARLALVRTHFWQARNTEQQRK